MLRGNVIARKLADKIKNAWTINNEQEWVEAAGKDLQQIPGNQSSWPANATHRNHFVSLERRL